MKNDPTRTKTLRGKFEREIAKRFFKLKQVIKLAIVDEDRFGLLPLTINVEREWAQFSDRQKVDAFGDYLAHEINSTFENADDAYWERYVQEGYEKGAGRAFTQANRGAFATAGNTGQAFLQGRQTQFVSMLLGAPETIEKVKLLAARTLSDITGVTDLTRAQIKRSLMEGLVQGQNPNVIARTMADQLDVSLKRAKTIARTEIIRAHAEGQLDAMEAMNIEQVGVMVEWSTAGDTRVCPLCSDMNGAVLRIREAHGLIPRHPNCRCAFMPANVGEIRKGQKRGAVKVRKAISKSKSKEPNTSWAKGKKISKNRPKEVKS